jgi:rare lipoprotein A
VTVRVNDRGPFIPGRVVDVSHSAAEALGMTQQGVAKEKLDVVE